MKITRLKDGVEKHKYDDHIEWLHNDVLHRSGDQPAIVYTTGRRKGLAFYLQHGQKHRGGDQPAVICPDGQLEWWQDGRNHRVGGPAIIFANKTEIWKRHGRKHRDVGPAITRSPDNMEWWQDGKRHRDRNHGPAIVMPNPDEDKWYENGKPVEPSGDQRMRWTRRRHLGQLAP